MDFDAVGFAYQIVNLHKENLRLRAEVERLREVERDYYALLDSSRAHNNTMMSHVLEAALGTAEWAAPKQKEGDNA